MKKILRGLGRVLIWPLRVIARAGRFIADVIGEAFDAAF